VIDEVNAWKPVPGITSVSREKRCPRQPKKVSGVYERNPGSGVFQVQYRLPAGPGEVRDKLIRKMVSTRRERNVQERRADDCLPVNVDPV
jgi:hypothetical protein